MPARSNTAARSAWFTQLPFAVQLMAAGSVAMLAPAVHAFALDLHRIAQPFFYGAVLFGVLTALLGLATLQQPVRRVARSQLLTLAAAFLVLPIMLAVPLHEARPSMSFFNAYFEMVSSITTTGATVFNIPRDIPEPLHLWRGLVAWMGGFLIILSAIAVLAPMTLGGFEVMRPSARGGGQQGRGANTANQMETQQRLSRFSAQLLPLYVGATGLLWLVLVVMGTEAFEALMVAMATMSTSGILPTSSLGALGINFGAELAVFLFLALAVTRQVLALPKDKRYFAGLSDDREMRIATVFVIVIPLVLWLRHFIGAFEINEEDNLIAALQALWGALFTVLSFLTTTGFVSNDWEAARAWSGLPTPGLVLAGLAIIGGGVATTAGGVKLLRFYALYKHGLREMERLVYPSSIGAGGRLGREVRREGAFIAWIFFMLFALSIAAVVVALTATGLNFDEAVVLAIAALSNTGPLAQAALEEGVRYSELTSPAKSILITAMVLGRMETLAIIALFNPDFWRR